jgi:hypothetical protein
LIEQQPLEVPEMREIAVALAMFTVLANQPALAAERWNLLGLYIGMHKDAAISEMQRRWPQCISTGNQNTGNFRCYNADDLMTSSIVWEGDKVHLIEFYCIATNSCSRTLEELVAKVEQVVSGHLEQGGEGYVPIPANSKLKRDEGEVYVGPGYDKGYSATNENADVLMVAYWKDAGNVISMKAGQGPILLK